MNVGFAFALFVTPQVLRRSNHPSRIVTATNNSEDPREMTLTIASTLLAVNDAHASRAIGHQSFEDPSSIET
jgi:hypothetical protein